MRKSSLWSCLLFRQSVVLVFIVFLFLSSTFLLSNASVLDAIFILGTVALQNTTKAAGLNRVIATFGAATFDANLDSWPDLLISNHGGPPSIYRNESGMGFRRVEKSLLKLRPSDRHTPALADYDNDGDQDLYFVHGAKSGTGLGPKEFFLNQGPGKPFRKINIPVIADPKGRGRNGIWFDYDSDGLLDLFLLNDFREDAPNRLFHNLGNGNFSDVSFSSGLAVHLSNAGGGAIAGDIDNDGDMDLFINSADRPYFFANDGNGVFRDQTAERRIPLLSHTWATGMADYNNDGYLDLYLARRADDVIEGALLGAFRLNFMHQVAAGIDPTDFLTFYAAPEAVLRFEFHKTIFTSYVDLENIYIGVEGRNPGKTKFNVGPGFFSPDGRPVQWKDDGSQKGTFIWRDKGTGLWTIAAGSGEADIFYSGGLVTSQSNMWGLEKFGMESSAVPVYEDILLENRNGFFLDVSQQKNVTDPHASASALWVDLDNDGDLDLFVVNAGFNGFGKQPNTLYLNDQGTFRQYSVPMENEERFGRGDGALTADFNKDGWLDLFIVNGSGGLPNSRGPYQLFLNRSRHPHKWLRFTLTGAGKNYTNRDAIGAKVIVKRSDVPNKAYWQYILGGNGSACQSSRTLHFGLGQAERVTARIYWPPSKSYPSGHQNVLYFSKSQLNQHYVVHELK